jgi:hypothetical protein
MRESARTLGRNDRGLLQVLFGNLRGQLEENYENLRMADVRAEIRIQHLPKRVKASPLRQHVQYVNTYRTVLLLLLL